MCGGSTTNVTNTGLGDDQYQQLVDNQTGIGTALDEGFIAGGERFDTVDNTLNQGFADVTSNQGEIYNQIGSRVGTNPLYSDALNRFSGDPVTASSTALRMGAGQVPMDLQYDVNGDGVVDQGDAQLLLEYGMIGQGAGTGLYGEFDAQNIALQNQGRTLTGLGSQLSDVSAGVGANQSSLTNLQGDVTGGFDTMGSRFDTVDAANTGIQTTVDQGFLDQTQGFNDLTGTVNQGFTDAQTNRDANLGTLGQNITDSTATTGAALDTVSSNVLAGQDTLTSDLAGLGTTLDTYGGQIMADQGALTAKQDVFQSSLDSFEDRYGDDVTLANQTRSDIQSGMTNELGRMREDLGEFAQAAATGNDALGRQITDATATTAAGMGTLASDIEGGFSQQAADQAVAQENLSTNLTDVRGLLQSTGDSLDDSTRSQYQSLVNSFDANGNLIQNAIDDQGNTITRALDDQNNVLETKFDSAGNQISQVSMDVDQMLTNAQAYKNDLSNQLTTASNDAMSQISTGFQLGNSEQMKQTRDLANIASGMSDLDINMRQDFNQIGKAFDNSGQLIQNSIEENGNTISRAVDKNGMLLLRRFDVTGNALGDKVINLARAYTNLNSISNMPGANAAMGTLSPALTGAVANSGFMSPYATTGA